jgi:hypothetical protein
VARNVPDVSIVPIETQCVHHQLQYTYIACIFTCGLLKDVDRPVTHLRRSARLPL